MKKPLKVIYTVVLSVILAAVCIQNAQAGEYELGRACYQKLLSAGKKAGTKEWSTCIGLFESMYKKEPNGKNAGSALFSAARLMQEHYAIARLNTDLEGAVKNFNQLIRQFPKSSLADDALYRIGCLRQETLGQNDRARKAFAFLLENYPDGDMAVHAKARLAALDGVQANPPDSLKEAKAIEKTNEPKEGGTIEEVGDEAAREGSDVVEEVSQPAEQQQKDMPGVEGKADAFNPATLTAVSTNDSAAGITVNLQIDRDVLYSTEYTETGLRTRSPPELNIVLLHTKLGGDLVRRAALESPYVKSYKIKNLFLSSGIKVTFTLDPSAGYEVTKDESGISVHFGERGNVKSAVSAPLASRRTSFNIVIDPGHGGEEEGAQGPGGTLEKDVTLSIAKLLAQRLRQDSGANVWLTRDDDRTLSLERRSELAVSKKADLFISIHANASRDKSASGIETYYLNNATDEAAARLAAFENRSTQKKLSEVEHIISTMLQNYDASESLDIATLVQSRLVNGLKSSDGKLKNRGVRSALFYVLVGAKCPAILVEAAFISNQKDENLLKEDKYQKDVAIAITDGVKKYLKVRDKALVSL